MVMVLLITLDLDSDGDGCSDAKEAGFTDIDDDGAVDGAAYVDETVIEVIGYVAVADTDNNGIADHLDTNYFDACVGDADNDGIKDDVDLDDDNDGIYDTYEGDDTVDTDGDGIPDYQILILMAMAVPMLKRQVTPTLMAMVLLMVQVLQPMEQLLVVAMVIVYHQMQIIMVLLIILILTI